MTAKPAKRPRKLAARYAKWREKNPDLYRERQRVYQAEYRRRQKEGRPAK